MIADKDNIRDVSLLLISSSVAVSNAIPVRHFRNPEYLPLLLPFSFLSDAFLVILCLFFHILHHTKSLLSLSLSPRFSNAVLVCFPHRLASIPPPSSLSRISSPILICYHLCCPTSLLLSSQPSYISDLVIYIAQ